MSVPRTSCTKLTLITVAAVILQFFGLSVFLFAFFPVKPTLSGHSGLESLRPPSCNAGGASNRSEASLPPDQLRSLYQEVSEILPPYDRLILMVIDALPAEFVLGKNGKPPRKAFMEAMPYTQSLLANGMAVGHHAVAVAPTVTMPRLKAIVSGAIGGFLDVAFNFNTQAYLDDNLLAQFFKIGWKMVMHGDDTWLKLFPSFFARHDGVGSFFVKDTVQVDQNVSRHLGEELSRDDWNILIIWVEHSQYDESLIHQLYRPLIAVEESNGNKDAMDLEIRSRGNVVGKLVRTKHHKEIIFPLVINSSESNLSSSRRIHAHMADGC